MTISDQLVVCPAMIGWTCRSEGSSLGDIDYLRWGWEITGARDNLETSYCFGRLL